MSAETQEFVHLQAKIAADLEHQSGHGSGYAVILGTIQGILVSPFSSDTERVEHCKLLLEAFDKEVEEK